MFQSAFKHNTLHNVWQVSERQLKWYLVYADRQRRDNTAFMYADHNARAEFSAPVNINETHYQCNMPNF